MQSFDFIVVGSGSAGSVLAEKLSASGRFSVLVLEAGGTDRRFYVQMPLGYGKTFFDPAVNWNYKAEPDPGLAGNADHWPRGKLLGGSSSINAMVYSRGQPGDFDDWEAGGNPGWGWKGVLPYFQKAENNALGGGDLRGIGGPLDVTDASASMHPLCQFYLRGCAELGFEIVRDMNGPRHESVGLYQITTKNGMRASAATAYLRPAMRRPNLRVVTDAHATKILFEGTRAIGVE